MKKFKFKDLMITISDPLAANACYEKSDICPQPSSPACRGKEEVSCQRPSNVEACAGKGEASCRNPSNPVCKGKVSCPAPSKKDCAEATKPECPKVSKPACRPSPSKPTVHKKQKTHLQEQGHTIYDPNKETLMQLKTAIAMLQQKTIIA